MKVITHNILLHNSQILHRCFEDPLGLKVLVNLLFATDESLQNSLNIS